MQGDPERNCTLDFATLSMAPSATSCMVMPKWHHKTMKRRETRRTYLAQVGTGMKTWASGLKRLWKSANKRQAPVPDRACTAATLWSANTLAFSPKANFMLWLLNVTLPPMGRYSLEKQTACKCIVEIHSKRYCTAR